MVGCCTACQSRDFEFRCTVARPRRPTTSRSMHHKIRWKNPRCMVGSVSGEKRQPQESVVRTLNKDWPNTTVEVWLEVVRACCALGVSYSIQLLDFTRSHLAVATGTLAILTLGSSRGGILTTRGNTDLPVSPHPPIPFLALFTTIRNDLALLASFMRAAFFHSTTGGTRNGRFPRRMGGRGSGLPSQILFRFFLA